jgi:hypothetical protein
MFKYVHFENCDCSTSKVHIGGGGKGGKTGPSLNKKELNSKNAI